MGTWLRVWGLGFWDLAEGLRLRVLGFGSVFWVWGFGTWLRVLGLVLRDLPLGLGFRDLA